MLAAGKNGVPSYLSAAARGPLTAAGKKLGAERSSVRYPLPAARSRQENQESRDRTADSWLLALVAWARPEIGDG